jgi:RNA polymerase sigma factor (sigma-70 family)
MLSELERTVQAPRPEPDWCVLAEAHDRVVWLYLLGRRVPVDQAEDLKQEVWATLIHKWQNGELAYIQMPGLALHQAELLIRRAQSARRCVAADNVVELADKRQRGQAGDIEAWILDRARLQRTLAVVDASPATMRAVFEHTYRGAAMSPEQVAAKIGISTQRVRQTLCKLRERLRRFT